MIGHTKPLPITRYHKKEKWNIRIGMFNCKKYTARNLAKHANSHGYHDGYHSAKRNRRTNMSSSQCIESGKMDKNNDDIKTIIVYKRSTINLLLLINTCDRHNHQNHIRQICQRCIGKFSS